MERDKINLPSSKWVNMAQSPTRRHAATSQRKDDYKLSKSMTIKGQSVDDFGGGRWIYDCNHAKDSIDLALAGISLAQQRVQKRDRLRLLETFAVNCVGSVKICYFYLCLIQYSLCVTFSM